MKKFVTLVLTIVSLFAISACSDDEPQTKTKSLKGIWMSEYYEDGKYYLDYELYTDECSVDGLESAVCDSKAEVAEVTASIIEKYGYLLEASYKTLCKTCGTAYVEPYLYFNNGYFLSFNFMGHDLFKPWYAMKIQVKGKKMEKYDSETHDQLHYLFDDEYYFDEIKLKKSEIYDMIFNNPHLEFIADRECATYTRIL